jgi:hypothetical protein
MLGSTVGSPYVGLDPPSTYASQLGTDVIPADMGTDMGMNFIPVRDT